MLLPVLKSFRRMLPSFRYVHCKCTTTPRKCCRPVQISLKAESDLIRSFCNFIEPSRRGVLHVLAVSRLVPDMGYSSVPHGRRFSDQADRSRIFDPISQVVVILLVGTAILHSRKQ